MNLNKVKVTYNVSFNEFYNESDLIINNYKWYEIKINQIGFVNIII